MKILITNDDGIHFPGLTDLADELSADHEIYIFAPAHEKSATSTAITIYTDIYVKKLKPKIYVVNGFPADCVNVGIHGNLEDVHFDLIISGINKGYNMGEDVIYSGTVGAAFHAYIHHYPAIAVSCGFLDQHGDFRKVAIFIRKFLKQHSGFLSQPVLLNINYPAEIKKDEIVKWTKLGRRIYRDSYKRIEQSDGSFLMNLGGSILNHKEEEGTDFDAVETGYISITPLTTDCTNYEQISRFSDRHGQRT